MDKAEFVCPSGPRGRSLGEVDQPPICCFVGPEARLGVMRGDVCVSCLWKSLDGMIWSACRCGVPLHLSDVRVESTYLHVSQMVGRVPRYAHVACRGQADHMVALLEGKKSDDMSARG